MKYWASPSGTVVWSDRFDLLELPWRLARVARLIRDFHDAVQDFTPPPDARWRALIPAEGGDIIAHNDLAPWNLVAGEQGWVFIDWDAAAPGSRLWDVAYAVHGFIPLSADPGLQRADAAARLRVFADAYGLDEDQRRRLVPLLGRRTRSMHDFLRDQAARGTQPWEALGAGSRRRLAQRRRVHRAPPTDMGAGPARWVTATSGRLASADDRSGERFDLSRS